MNAWKGIPTVVAVVVLFAVVSPVIYEAWFADSASGSTRGVSWEYAQLQIKGRIVAVYSWRTSKVNHLAKSFDEFVAATGADTTSFMGVLDHFGAQGWELVSQDTGYSSSHDAYEFGPSLQLVDSHTLYFKRRRCAE